MNVEATRRPMFARSVAKPMSQPLDLVELMSIFRRRLKLFLVIFILVTLAGIAATMMLKPEYTSTAMVKIDPNNRLATDQTARPGSDQSVASYIDTEISVAKSQKVAEEVVRSLDLAHDPEFGVKQPLFGKAKPVPKGAPDAKRIATVAGRVLKKLSVGRQGTTYLVGFAFTARDRDKAAAIANAFAEEYIISSIKLRQETMDAQARALAGGTERLSQEASSAAAAAAGYRANTGLVNAANGTVLQQQATTIAGQLSMAEANLATARSQLSQARAQVASGQWDSVVGVLNSPVIQNLRSQRAQLIKDRDNLSTRYGPRHPDYVANQQQLEGVEQQIQQESQRVIAGLEATANAAEAQVGALRGSLNRLQGQLAATSRTEAYAQGLEQEAKAKQDIYNQYNLAQSQANQAKTLQEPQGVILTRAQAAGGASFPNTKLFALLSAVLGAILGAVAIFVAEALEPGLLNARDTETALQQPVLASVPLLSERVLAKAGRVGPEGYAMAKPMSAFAEAFRAVRSALVLSHAAAPPKVICITSALPNEGKSVGTLTFARVLGLGGSRIVVVDCDLRRSTLGNLTRAETDYGLVEVLTGAAPLEKALMKDEVDGVSILPLSSVSFSPEDVLGSAAFARLLETLRARFDFVVLDTPPVLAVADARIVAALSDAVVFLCRWSKTPRAAAAAAIGLLEQDGAKIAGVVLNMVDFSAKGTLSADDPGYYHKAYQGYYVG